MNDPKRLHKTHKQAHGGGKTARLRAAVWRLEDVTELEGSIWTRLPALEIPFKVESDEVPGKK